MKSQVFKTLHLCLKKGYKIGKCNCGEYEARVCVLDKQSSKTGRIFTREIWDKCVKDFNNSDESLFIELRDPHDDDLLPVNLEDVAGVVKDLLNVNKELCFRPSGYGDVDRYNKISEFHLEKISCYLEPDIW